MVVGSVFQNTHSIYSEFTEAHTHESSHNSAQLSWMETALHRVGFR
jgi:hypothetical protein